MSVDKDFKKNKTTGPVKGTKSVTILLDRSGSMTSGWDETLGSINAYVEELEPEVHVKLFTFDSAGFGRDAGVSFDKIRSTTANLWERVTGLEIQPRGGTPLYDCAAKAVDSMLEDNYERSLFVVMTDGAENSSREYTLDAVRSKLKLLETKGWPTVFLGSDFHEVTTYTTSTFQVNAGQTVNINTGGKLGAMRGIIANKTGEYFATGAAETMSFNEQEKEAIAKEATK